MRAAIASALFLLAFLTTGRILAPLRPPPADSVLEAKIDFLRRHPGRYDLVFVGSSGVYRHVVPDEVDRVLAERGLAVRSFNAGAPGMRGFEAAAALERVLDAVGERRAVAFEPSRFSPDLHPANEFAERTVAWHTARWTARAVAASLASDRPFAERLSLAARHVRLFLWRATGYGTGPRIVLDLLGRKPPPALTDAEIAAHAGWRPLEADVEAGDAAVRERRRLFLEAGGRFEGRVEKLRRTRAARAAFPEREEEWLRALASRMRGRSGRAVGLIPPLVVPQPAARSLAERGIFDCLLSYQDPDRHPEWFTREARFDENHLLAPFARAFSRVLAADLADRCLGPDGWGGR